MPQEPRARAEYFRRPYDQSLLLVFLDGHFHPDWRLDDRDVVSVIRGYRTEAPDRIEALIADIGQLVDQLRDHELGELVEKHLDNLTEGDRLGMPLGPWLLWLRRQLDPKRYAATDRFIRDKRRIIESSVPSGGDNLLGMEIDIDAYLADSGLCEDSEIERTGLRECLLVCRGRATAGISPARAAAELEWVWLDKLRYRFFEAHGVHWTEETARLEFVTQISDPGFYVTGQIDVILNSTSPWLTSRAHAQKPGA